MSIINQTLRELDARASADVAIAPLGGVAPWARRRLVVGRWGMWIVVVVLVIAAWGWWVVVGPARSSAAAPRSDAHVIEPVTAPATMASAPQAIKTAQPAQERFEDRVPGESDAITPQAMPHKVGLSLTLDTELPEAHEKTSITPLIEKRVQPPSPDETAEMHYRKALTSHQAGLHDQARSLLEEALERYPAHVPARQALVSLLIEAGRLGEAEEVLMAGRTAVPGNAWFTLGLARLQAARGDVRQAIATLRQGLDMQGVDADYHATLAALLVQADMASEAVPHYRQALAGKPGAGIWWAGLGLALAAEGEAVEARSAYERALLAGRLPESLAAFVRAKLEE